MKALKCLRTTRAGCRKNQKPRSTAPLLCDGCAGTLTLLSVVLGEQRANECMMIPLFGLLFLHSRALFVFLARNGGRLVRRAPLLETIAVGVWGGLWQVGRMRTPQKAPSLFPELRTNGALFWRVRALRQPHAWWSTVRVVTLHLGCRRNNPVHVLSFLLALNNNARIKTPPFLSYLLLQSHNPNLFLFRTLCCLTPTHVCCVLSWCRVTPVPSSKLIIDYTPSRSQTPASESRALGSGGSVRLHAQRIFTVSDEEVEEMLKTKVKGASKVKTECCVLL